LPPTLCLGHPRARTRVSAFPDPRTFPGLKLLILGTSRAWLSASGYSLFFRPVEDQMLIFNAWLCGRCPSNPRISPNFCFGISCGVLPFPSSHVFLCALLPLIAPSVRAEFKTQMLPLPPSPLCPAKFAVWLNLFRTQTCCRDFSFLRPVVPCPPLKIPAHPHSVLTKFRHLHVRFDRFQVSSGEFYSRDAILPSVCFCCGGDTLSIISPPLLSAGE